MAKRRETEADILLWDQLTESWPLHAKKEHRFYIPRRWRFDFVVEWNAHKKIAIEIEGGVWVRGGGGHNRGKAFIDDMEKYNHAALLGWRVLRFTPQQVLKGEAIAFIKRVLES